MSNILFVVFATLLANECVFGGPVNFEEEVDEEDSFSSSSSSEESNVTYRGRDLYVIRKVVYEIGILTDADNSTEYDNRTHEQIDLSFFDPSDNGTFVDLSRIPIPVEANVSGVALTGILPVNFGSIFFPENGTAASLNESNIPIFPDKQVKVTKNISTVDREESANILSGISDVLGLSNLVTPKYDQDQNRNESSS